MSDQFLAEIRAFPFNFAPNQWAYCNGQLLAISQNTALFALLDLYTVHGVAIPYYTGMIQHRANGSVGALHWAGLRSVGFGGAVERLTAFKSPIVPAPVLVGLWLLYLLGTVGAVACACARKCDSAANSQG